MPARRNACNIEDRAAPAGSARAEQAAAEQAAERGKLLHQMVPGALVRHPTETGWGIGQVQSAIGNRVTVNFEHAGKRLINTDVIDLVIVVDEGGPG